MTPPAQVKGRVRARGARGQNWFSESKASYCKKKSRTQALWSLHLAGDWHPAYETCSASHAKPRLMRCMLVSNLAVDNRFANGTQGRVLYWSPDISSAQRKAVMSSRPDVFARFAKESSMKKAEMIADLDHMDICARQETLNQVPGHPVLLQAPRFYINSRVHPKAKNGRHGQRLVQIDLDLIAAVLSLAAHGQREFQNRKYRSFGNSKNDIEEGKMQLQVPLVPAYALTVRGLAPTCSKFQTQFIIAELPRTTREC